MRQWHSKIPTIAIYKKSFQHDCVDILDIVSHIAVKNTVCRSEKPYSNRKKYKVCRVWGSGTLASLNQFAESEDQ